MYLIIVSVFTVLYALLIGIYYRAWDNLPAHKFSLQKGGRKFISVIIPARDEAVNIDKCVRSVAGQDYSSDHFEIIVVDDHSEDDTAGIVEAMGMDNVRVIRMADIPLDQGEVAYKKRAIETGVAQCKGVIVVTTDADCSHHPSWLATIENAFQKTESDMLSGPVLFESDDSVFQSFQALDFVGMIGITAASLHLGMFNLANGANLAFRKKAFEEVGGYSGIDEKASGDDMLLIYKIAQRDPEKVHFLKSKEAVVTTRPAGSLGEFIQQRLRWTSKSFSYQDKRITWILAFVYLTNVLLMAGLFLYLFTWNASYLLASGLQFAFMTMVDFIFLKRVTSFFDRRELMTYILPSQILHVVYIVVIGLMGNVVKYDWKGRKLK